jgi:fatty acid desaturase
MSSAPPSSSPPRVETPTLLLWIAIHGGWTALTFFHDKIPLALLALGGGWLVAWHGSYQHEAIHGHPTRSRRINAALASVPLSLWLPFPVYRRSHTAHHASHDLTSPEHDPEARYLSGAKLGSPARRALSKAASTLAGRLLIGPFAEVGGFLVDEAKLILSNREDRRAIWAIHAVLVATLMAWVVGVCGMNPAKYLLAFVYPGAALSLIRSFAEHRAHVDPAQRIAIVENAPVLGLLFLNNNLHVAHHERPAMAWYDLPAFHARQRARLVASNGGLVYDGYADVFRRYFLRPHDHIDHAVATERSR